MLNNVLVFGTGFLGRNIIDFLLLEGCIVTSVSRNSSSKQEHPNLIHLNIDLLKEQNLSSMTFDFQSIIYAVSLDVPGVVENKLTFEDEIQSFTKVLNLAIQRPKTKLIFISSASVYGASSGACSSEEDFLNPSGLYATMKIQMEQEALSYVHYNNLDLKILRVANVYGPYQIKQGILAKILNSYFNNDKIQLLNNGLTVRDFLFVDDLSRVISFLIKSNTKEVIYNISSNHGITINELIEQISGFIPAIQDRIVIKNTLESISKNVLCNKKIKNEFPMWQLTPLKEGLTQTLHWWKNK